MTRASDASGAGLRLPTDELFVALAHRTRRIVLFHLHQQGAATGDELVDVVRASTDPPADVGADDPYRVAMTLAEHHLPILERLDLVVYDRLYDTVTLGDIPGDLDDWLALAIRRDLRRAETREQAVESEGRDKDEGAFDFGDSS